MNDDERTAASNADSSIRPKGFTLVELLVVIGIIAVLISVLLPALAKARRQAQIVQCGANLHNIGLSLLNYASQYNNALPLIYSDPANAAYAAANPGLYAFPVNGGNWMWDIGAPVRNALIRNGCNRANFYCPSNADQNVNPFWNYSITATDKNGTVLFSGPPYADSSGNSYDSWPMPNETGFCHLGYIFLIKRLDGAMGPTAANPNGLLASPDNRLKHFDWQTRIKPHNTAAVLDPTKYVRPNISSQTEIAFDTICCDGNPATFNAPKFGSVGGLGIVFPSSHWNGTGSNYGYPAGGNYLCLDGHVEWRPITKGGVGTANGLNERVITGPTSNPIAFWW
jgi:prepilin-type N-terminal cleavage/methylation domain-containing protein